MTASRPLRALADVSLGKMRTPDSDAGTNLVPYLRAANVADGVLRLDDVKSMHFEPAELDRHRLRAGDVLVTEASGSRDQVGQTCIYAGEVPHAAMQNTLLRLRPREGTDARYLYWWSRFAFGAGLYAEASQGLGIWHLGSQRMQRLQVPVWPLDHQRRIADFLDDKVGALEEAGALHKRLLALLDERVDAAVGDRIARALGGSAEYPMVPIKRLLRKVVRPATPDAEVVTAFRDGQVIARAVRRAEGYTESATDASAVQGVGEGDVVIHGLDGFSGAVGTSESAGVCSPANHVCVPRDGGDSDYYGRLLRVFALSGYLSLYGGSSRERAVDFRNWGTFSRTPLPLLPVGEQFEIGEAIRAARPLGGHVDLLLGLLAEKRQALVTAAVTGQLDVTTARSVA